MKELMWHVALVFSSEAVKEIDNDDIAAANEGTQNRFLFHRLLILPHQVKRQCLQILNIIDTSIKYAISGQSTSVVKGCMYICLTW